MKITMGKIMPSKKKLDEYYMSLALRVAELSHGARAKVWSI